MGKLSFIAGCYPTVGINRYQRLSSLIGLSAISLGLGLGIGLTSMAPIYADPMPKGAAADSSTSLYHFNQARYFEREGQWEKAEAEFRQAIFKAPNDYLNYARLGSLLARFGKTNEALTHYQKAIALAPPSDNINTAMLSFSLGSLYESLGQYAQAKTAYLRTIQLNPDYHYANYNLAKVQMQLSEFNEAQEAFKRFLAVYPTHYEARRYLANVYLANRQPDLSAREYEALKTQSPERFNDSLNLARALTQADSPEQALDELKTAYTKEGNKADILEAMGNAHLALGQNEYAIHNYEQSYQMDNTRYGLLLKVADGYQKSQKTDQSVKALKEYLTHQPDDTAAKHWLAQSLTQQKQYDAALSMLNEVLSATQDPTQRYQVNKEMAYIFQSKGDLSNAINRYQALLAQEPQAAQDTQLKTNLAIAYHKQGQLDKAIALYQGIYEQLPQATQPEQERKALLANDMANALTTLGDQAYQEKRYQDALQIYAQATRYSRNDSAFALIGLGNTHLALNQWDLAQAAYEQALQRQPEQPLALLYLGKARLSSGQPQTAIEPLKQLLSQENLESGLQREAYLSLGDAYHQSGDMKEAANHYEKAQSIGSQMGSDTATALNPNGNPNPNAEQNVSLLLTLGTLRQQMGEYDKAKAAYEQVLAQEPGNAKALYNMGIVLNELGQFDASAKAYQDALKADPNFNETRYGLAVTFEKQQKYPLALQTYQEYLRAPDSLYAKEANERVRLLQEALSPSAATPNKTPAKPITPST